MYRFGKGSGYAKLMTASELRQPFTHTVTCQVHEAEMP